MQREFGIMKKSQIKFSEKYKFSAHFNKNYEFTQCGQSREYIFLNFRIFILHDNASIWGTLLLQNFVSKPIKLISQSFGH